MSNFLRFRAVPALSVAALLLAACSKDDSGTQAPAASQPTSTVPNTANAGVMMQAFYWDVPQNNNGLSWWELLESQTPALANAGITAVWIPPAYKGYVGINDVGYGVYDRYDLGEFNQKGAVRTRYGTLGQLQSCITALHGRGMKVYEDIVMNHMMGADAQESFSAGGTTYNVWTSFTFPGRGNTYSSFRWNYSNFNGAQQAANNGFYQWHAWDFTPYANGDAYDNLLGCEINYTDAAQRTETKAWGTWITNKLQLDGYRVDATKHILTSFVNEWLDEVKGPNRFAVSEAWFGDLTNLQNYASTLGNRTYLFDVPLHYAFQRMGGSSFSMQDLAQAGFTGSNGDQSVTFVDNHDTDQTGAALYSPVSMKMLAYSYILTRGAGYPCVFYKDYYNYGYGADIDTLLSIRKAHAYGDGLEYARLNTADLYVYGRSGDATHTGLLQLLNDGLDTVQKGVTTPFKNATLHDATGHQSGTVTTDANGYGTFSVGSRNYSIWVPN